MLRCSSLMQVKWNWYHMKTIALTVKRNNCKTPLLEAAYQVTSFLSNVSFLESFCSFNVWCFKSLQVFSFAIIHRSWHQNFPLKNMIRVLKEMLGWFWIFVWVFMLIPTSNNISFRFAYGIFLTRAYSFTDFTWRVWIFFLQREKLSDFLCFWNNSKIILFFGENLQFL